MMRFVVLSTVLIPALYIPNSWAYVGPGLGLGALGAMVGMVLAVLLAILGVIWYPLKRALRKPSAAQADTDNTREEEGCNDSERNSR